VQDLNAMALFAAIVDEGSLSAAARMLGISKSAASKQLARLEETLGARLLNRTTRRLRLTEIGAAYYEHCAQIVAQARDAERAVTSLSAAPRGTLRANLPMSFGLRHIRPLVPELLQANPELTLDLTFTDRFVDMVEEGFDVVVRIAALPDSNLVARLLGETRSAVVASPAYWDAQGRPATPDELTAHNCFAYAYLSDPRGWPFRYRDTRRQRHVRVSGNLQSNVGEVLTDAAVAGLGVAYMPTFLCGDALAAGDLEAVLVNYEMPPTGIYAIYPHRHLVSPKVRAFVDFLVDRFQPVPPWQVAAPTPLQR